MQGLFLFIARVRRGTTGKSSLRVTGSVSFCTEDGGRKPPDYASGTNDKGVPGEHDAADTAQRHQQEDKYYTDFCQFML